MQKQTDILKIFKQSFDELDPEVVAEAKDIILAKQLSYDELAHQTAWLWVHLNVADFALERLHEEFKSFHIVETIVGSPLTAEQRTAALAAFDNRYATFAKQAIAAQRASVAGRGGKAKAAITEAENRAILEAYQEHTELHHMSGSRAADHLMDKHPEITRDKAISHRRITDLIVGSRKKSASC